MPTKRLRPSTAPKPSRTATCPPATVSKAPASVTPQTNASENRSSPLEDVPVCVSIPCPSAGKMLGNLFEHRNWLLPPNYLNHDTKNATGIASPKPPINEESKIGEQSIISPKTDGDQIVPSARIRTRKIWMVSAQANNNKEYHPSQVYKNPK